MLRVLTSGGLLMIPIGICAIVATFIIFERFFYFLGIKKKHETFLLSLSTMLSAHRYDDALALCKNLDTPESKVVAKAIQCRNWPEDHIKEAVSVEIDLVTPELEHLLTPLGTIANISTLLGLLGTVTGNIQAFGVLGAGASMGNPALLAGAIAEALVTTASGLGISIPSVIFHNYFVSRVNRHLAIIEATATSVVLQLCGHSLLEQKS
ncbi:MAG: MotA/TolQ/ExbB proton channel family protein [Spirochaetaceae bacterium]|nr:MotA/TolQ/ExbB proton channel family protein [Spirochaetaceae bacterium]MBO5236566.1 MotA/TolQ/ExbB proton channel family protein [Spirochaetaceae bacterium]